MKLTIPHWIIVLVALLGTLGPQVAQAFPSLAQAIGIFDQLDALVLGALGILTGSALKPGAAASVATKMLSIFSLLVAALLLGGCLSSAPIVPVTAANQAQVTTCENAATLHNDMVIGDFVFTGAAGGLSTAGAFVSASQAKTDLAIGGAIAGAGAVIASSIVALSASDFANNQCSSVVGPLPVNAPAGAK